MDPGVVLTKVNAPTEMSGAYFIFLVLDVNYCWYPMNGRLLGSYGVVAKFLVVKKEEDNSTVNIKSGI